jgi:hypothetical protein
VANTATKEQGIDVRLWFREPPHNSTASAADQAGSAAVLAFLAGAAAGHHLGATILVSSAWTSPAALAWSLPSRSSQLAHLGWMAASLVIMQTETCQRR